MNASHIKIMELVKKHQLGFLYNPGGGQFVRLGENPINIQVSAMDENEDYKELFKELIKLGLESE